MNLQKKLEKSRVLFDDYAFAVWLLEMETIEEVQAALAESGLDFSVEEINKIREDVLRCLETGCCQDGDGSAISNLAAAVKAALNVSGESMAKGRW